MAELDDLVAAVRASRNYRRVTEQLVREIGARELQKGRSVRDAVKATKNKLHQVGGAYLPAAMRYDEWLAGLRAAAGDADRLREQCRAVMSHHASTRERLPILDQFYATMLAPLAPVTSVLDLACGLNPLAIPWMPLAPGARYHAYDIYEDMMAFLAAFFPLAGVQGVARACDVIHAPPQQRAQVALLLKALPCLDQAEPSAGLRLLDAVAAEHVVVSFPVASLGGRDKNMVRNYERSFREAVQARPWAVERFEFATELAFLIHKSTDQGGNDGR